MLFCCRYFDRTPACDYAGLALVFAELTDCRPVWKQALEGWNVEQSIQVLEWQAQAKADDLLRVLGKRFPPGATPDLERSIRQTTDVEQLGRWLDAALDAGTLTAFRHKAGLPAQNGGRRQTNKTKRSTGRRKK